MAATTTRAVNPAKIAKPHRRLRTLRPRHAQAPMAIDARAGTRPSSASVGNGDGLGALWMAAHTNNGMLATAPPMTASKPRQPRTILNPRASYGPHAENS